MTERMAIGTQLLDERDVPDGPGGLWEHGDGRLWEQGDGRPSEQGDPVTPGRDGTLLAVVPLPGTGTSLAVVGYVVSTGRPRDATQQIAPAPAPAPAQARPRRPLIAMHPIGLTIDEAQRRAWIDGAEVPLTFQEFELLAFLVGHPETVFSRAELAAQVWHREFGQDSRTVDVHVSRVRAKLGPVYGRFLVTEYRAGYQYRPPRP